MIFNFAQRRKSKKRAKTTSLAPSPDGEGCGTRCAADAEVVASDRAGAPIAFGSVYSALSDMEVGGRGILGEFDMPEQVAEQLMNLGFVPGLEVTVAQSGPGGDPRVYRVDGLEVALRGELAKLIAVAPAAEPVAERTLCDQRTLPLRDRGAAPAVVKERKKRPTLRCAKDGAPLDTRRDVGLSTQEASAD